VAPEAFFPGYNAARVAELAQPRSGDWHRSLSARAHDPALLQIQMADYRAQKVT
jgi:hypothetical protein